MSSEEPKYCITMDWLKDSGAPEEDYKFCYPYLDNGWPSGPVWKNGPRDTNYPGDDIKRIDTVDQMKCMDECVANSECSGLVYSDKSFWLKKPNAFRDTNKKYTPGYRSMRYVMCTHSFDTAGTRKGYSMKSSNPKATCELDW